MNVGKCLSKNQQQWLGSELLYLANTVFRKEKIFLHEGIIKSYKRHLQTKQVTKDLYRN